MSYSIRGIQYYRTIVSDTPDAAYELLSILAELGVDLLAFTAVPSGADQVQLTLAPDDPSRLEAETKRVGIALEGPHGALLVQGDDELGALAEIHRRLADASVPVYASTGVSDGRGAFGYLIYVQEGLFDRAMAALEAAAA
jgi:hypothetical protein